MALIASGTAKADIFDKQLKKAVEEGNVESVKVLCTSSWKKFFISKKAVFKAFRIIANKIALDNTRISVDPKSIEILRLLEKKLKSKLKDGYITTIIFNTRRNYPETMTIHNGTSGRYTNA
jgi:hypothetical protein